MSVDWEKKGLKPNGFLKERQLSKKRHMGVATKALAEQLAAHDIKLTAGALAILRKREMLHRRRELKHRFARNNRLAAERRKFEHGLEVILNQVEPGTQIDSKQIGQLLRGLCPGFPPFC